jgi:antitoxin component HigA of HigAB toxin-antitoxin module
VVEKFMTAIEMLGNEIRNLKVRAPETNKAFLRLLREIPPRPIETQEEYDLFLEIVKKIDLFLTKLDAEKSLAQSQVLRERVEGYARYAKVVGELIEHFERMRYPAKGKPEDALAFLMEQHGLVQTSLSKELGGQSVVSSILKGKRKLNLEQIRRLAARFNVSPLTFISR